MQKFKDVLTYLFSLGMLVNIIALLPQPIAILVKKSAENVSITTWLIFFVFQTIVALHGKLNLNSKSMFWGMAGSAVVSGVTVVLCFVY